MTLRQKEVLPQAGEVSDAEPPMLGYIRSQDRGAGDAILTDVARRLIAQGVRVRGATQVNSERCDSQRCDMDVEVLPAGPRLRVSQSLGTGARGCRLDSGALETAVASVTASFGPDADLLIVNKFGKQEACGAGFRALIGEAIALGVPVLTSVNALNEAAFCEFAAGMQIRLQPTEEILIDWFRSVRSPR